MLAGTELIIDAFECASHRVRDLSCVRSVCDRIIEELGLTVIGIPQWHQFPDPFGVTGLYLLSESHLTCHTFPEFGLATLNLYCCRQRPEWPWELRLQEMLDAKYVEIRNVLRGNALPIGEEELFQHVSKTTLTASRGP